jgi:hypothetical protein
MATIPEIETRIYTLWTKGEARTSEEAVALGQLLTAFEAEMPPGDFYRHVLEVLHIPARDAQHFMVRYPRVSGGGQRVGAGGVIGDTSRQRRITRSESRWGRDWAAYRQAVLHRHQKEGVGGDGCVRSLHPTASVSKLHAVTSA